MLGHRSGAPQFRGHTRGCHPPWGNGKPFADHKTLARLFCFVLKSKLGPSRTAPPSTMAGEASASLLNPEPRTPHPERAGEPGPGGSGPDPPAGEAASPSDGHTAHRAPALRFLPGRSAGCAPWAALAVPSSQVCAQRRPFHPAGQSPGRETRVKGTPGRPHVREIKGKAALSGVGVHTRAPPFLREDPHSSRLTSPRPRSQLPPRPLRAPREGKGVRSPPPAGVEVAPRAPGSPAASGGRGGGLTPLLPGRPGPAAGTVAELGATRGPRSHRPWRGGGGGQAGPEAGRGGRGPDGQRARGRPRWGRGRDRRADGRAAGAARGGPVGLGARAEAGGRGAREGRGPRGGRRAAGRTWSAKSSAVPIRSFWPMAAAGGSAHSLARSLARSAFGPSAPAPVAASTGSARRPASLLSAAPAAAT